MSADTALARGRTRAEEAMVDTCTIRRVTGTTTDPATGVVTPTYSVLYTGRCRFQQQAASASAVDVGQARLLMLRLELQLPASVTALQAEDQVTANTSRFDPDLPGRVFLIKDLAHKTHTTARRVGIEERTS